MRMTLLVVVASVMYAAFALLIGVAGARGLNPYLNTATYNTLGGLAPLAGYVLVRQMQGSAQVPASGHGWAASVLAGFAIGAFNLVLLSIIARGGVAYAIPAVFGGSTVLSALAGWFLLGERFVPLHAAGVGFVAVGVGMIVASKA